MKIPVRKHLNQRGFIHHIIPVVAFIALFAVVGGYFLLRGSLAASSNFPAFESTNDGYCLDNIGGTAEQGQCTKASSSVTVVDGGDVVIKINGQCLQENSRTSRAVFSTAACAGTSQYDFTALSGSYIESWANTSTCLGASSALASTPLAFHPCSQSGYYKNWKQTTMSVTSPTPIKPIPILPPTPAPVSPGPTHCVSYEFYYYEPNTTTGNGQQCVKILQNMIYNIGHNYQYANYVPSYLYPPDGIYGINTENQVKAFQVRFDLHNDGVVGTNTWQKLCSLTPTTTYLYTHAGCGSAYGDAQYP